MHVENGKEFVDKTCTEFKLQDFCHVHNNNMEVGVGNEILKSQAPSNNDVAGWLEDAFASYGLKVRCT